MRVLFLGPSQSPTRRVLEAAGEEVAFLEGRLDRATLDTLTPDFLVSHGYRHIIDADVLGRVGERAVNLHISLLPWNRGADPNLWSWIDHTPKGVTVHHIDEHMDTGDIIAQRAVAFGPGETLATSYARLQSEMTALFAEQWPLIRTGRARRTPQSGAGSLHRVADRAAVEHLMSAGWQTPVSVLEQARRDGRAPSRTHR